MSRRKRPEQAWVNGAEWFRIAQQYADLPQYGLVFRVEQRTTLAGRAILLSPDQVAGVHAWLGEWLQTLRAGAVPAGPAPAVPALVCPGCGSPDVDFERGLLFCGACAKTTDLWGDGSDD